jgi:hypothetical protein
VYRYGKHTDLDKHTVQESQEGMQRQLDTRVRRNDCHLSTVAVFMHLRGVLGWHRLLLIQQLMFSAAQPDCSYLTGPS